MKLARTMLRKVMRNQNALVGGLGLIYLALVSPACAVIAGFDDSPNKAAPSPGSQGGSAVGPGDVPPDTTLPPAPTSNCGDVKSSGDNCGFCGHSCAGDACGDGLCAANVVVQATSTGATGIDGFVTDGTDLFTLNEHSISACNAAGPSTQTCSEVISGDEVGPVLYTGQSEESSWGNWGNWGGSSKKTEGVSVWIPLVPRAIALRAGNLLIADDAYHVVISCPSHGACNHENVALIDARSTSLSETKAFGKQTLSILDANANTPAGVAWSQGDAIRAAVIPTSPRQVESTIVARDALDTKATARILTPASSDVFWLSQEGLYHSSDVQTALPQRLFLRQGATDFSVDSKSAYLASPTGIFRVARSDQAATIAAPNAFEKVATTEDGAVGGSKVYATQKVGATTTLVEVRAQNTILTLASVQGSINAIAVAGNYVYFMTHTATGVQIRRVAR